MLFDSHIATLLEVAVDLVNVLTDGAAGGRSYTAPEREERPRVIAGILPAESRWPVGRAITQEEADYLAETAGAMRAIFDAVNRGEIGRAASVLNRLLISTGARPQLDQLDSEPWQVHFHGSDDSLAIGWSAGCATALALAVGSHLAGRLGVCSADLCDRVYIDSSRNAARRFCSTPCQNRTKAAAFRARHAGRR
ncbi:CGNR zinc finger domain-containing protein [Actinopolymorpha sp. B17G11]|uniref:CGNR zinc finger domain-containing protein n=1 Tax=Actinopolymorpha sp. B17G11 TaxID=3160861 RepID=UPI0032E50AAD